MVARGPFKRAKGDEAGILEEIPETTMSLKA